MEKRYLLLLYFLFAVECQMMAQFTCALDLEIASGVDTSLLHFSLDYGHGPKEFRATGPKMHFADSVYSRYATFVIYVTPQRAKHPSSIYSFYLSNTPAIIRLDAIRKDSSNLILDYTQSNAHATMEIKTRMLNFVKSEQKAVDSFIASGSILDSNYFVLYKKLIDKQLDFIAQNKSDYYSFRLFSTLSWIKYPQNYSYMLADILPFYYNTFERSLRESSEGTKIEDRLKKNLFYLEEGMQVPNVAFTDYKGKAQTIDDFKGKYLLVSLWASWCPPCMHEVPKISAIRAKYSNDKLAIISISYDGDSSAFLRTIAKYKMDWINIYRNNDLPDRFGIDRNGIPQLLLIDGNGIVKFTLAHFNGTNDEAMLYLNKLLDEQLKETTN